MTVLAVWAGQAGAANYVNLAQGTEKWFASAETGKCVPCKMRTVVSGFHERASIMHRAIMRGDATEKIEELLFSANPEGDMYFHGDLREEVFAQPVLWVDVPLDVGKTWTASRPEIRGPKDDVPEVHYVFAVLEKKEIACPAGIFKCARVFVAEIAPDGAVKNWPGPPPDARVQAREQNSLVNEAMANLEYKYRVLLVLRHFLNFSYAEIALIIDLPTTTVRSRIHTARRLLRDQLYAYDLIGA